MVYCNIVILESVSILALPVIGWVILSKLSTSLVCFGGGGWWIGKRETNGERISKGYFVHSTFSISKGKDLLLLGLYSEVKLT